MKVFLRRARSQIQMPCEQFCAPTLGLRHQDFGEDLSLFCCLWYWCLPDFEESIFLEFKAFAVLFLESFSCLMDQHLCADFFQEEISGAFRGINRVDLHVCRPKSGGRELFLEYYLLDGKQLPEQQDLPQKVLLTSRVILFSVKKQIFYSCHEKNTNPPSEIPKPLIK